MRSSSCSMVACALGRTAAQPAQLGVDLAVREPGAVVVGRHEPVELAPQGDPRAPPAVSTGARVQRCPASTASAAPAARGLLRLPPVQQQSPPGPG